MRQPGQIIADKERKKTSDKRREKGDEESAEEAHEERKSSLLGVDRIVRRSILRSLQQLFERRIGASAKRGSFGVVASG